MKAGVEQDFRKVSNAPEKVSNATKNKDWNKNEETINN